MYYEFIGVCLIYEAFVKKKTKKRRNVKTADYERLSQVSLARTSRSLMMSNAILRKWKLPLIFQSLSLQTELLQ